jgi:hypothetical protein
MVAVQVFIPVMQPMYAIAERLFRYASMAFQPVQQLFQSSVPADDDMRPRRIRIAAFAAIGIGVVAGTLITLLSPWASALLSGGHITVPVSVALPFGVAFIGVATASVVGYVCLVSLGRVRSIAVSTRVGGLIGAPLISAFAAGGSVPAVAWAVAIMELCVAGYQLAVLRKALHQHTAHVKVVTEE